MKIAMIVATDVNNVIGYQNRLPWHMPADLKYFKTITMGKPIIMGRKTFESIGFPLPGRQNVVVTCNKEYAPENVLVCHSVTDALTKVARAEEVMIIGGAEIFKQSMPLVDTIYLTRIAHEFQGDTFLPELNNDEWQETSREDHQPDAANPYPYSFIVLNRKKGLNL